MSENIREGLVRIIWDNTCSRYKEVYGELIPISAQEVAGKILSYLRSQIKWMPLLSKEEIKKIADFAKVLFDLTPIDDDLETLLYTAVLEGAKTQKQDILALFSEE